jgi:hypothetical protein
MMTTDPNRLLMIIKDRHVLVDRLKKLLVISKGDNAGDCFKINRMLKHQQQGLKELEQYLHVLIAQRKGHEAVMARERIKAEELEIVRLRLQLDQWGLE